MTKTTFHFASYFQLIYENKAYKENSRQKYILFHLMYNTNIFLPLPQQWTQNYSQTASSPSPLLPPNHVLILPLLLWPCCGMPSFFNDAPSPPARFHEPELNPVADSCFANCAECQEFLSGRTESNSGVQGSTLGLTGACYSQGSPQLNNSSASPPKILLFSPYWTVHSFRLK